MEIESKRRWRCLALSSNSKLCCLRKERQPGSRGLVGRRPSRRPAHQCGHPAALAPGGRTGEGPPPGRLHAHGEISGAPPPPPPSPPWPSNFVRIWSFQARTSASSLTQLCFEDTWPPATAQLASATLLSSRPLLPSSLAICGSATLMVLRQRCVRESGPGAAPGWQGWRWHQGRGRGRGGRGGGRVRGRACTSPCRGCPAQSCWYSRTRGRATSTACGAPAPTGSVGEAASGADTGNQVAVCKHVMRSDLNPHALRGCGSETDVGIG